MPPLPNSRHEQFALLVARGASASTAYVAAGYVAKSASVAAVNASRLLSRDKVSARVAELRAAQSIAMLERLEISREEILRRYVTIVQADANDLVEVKVSACRRCHGEGHRYHWRSRAEFEEAHATWVKKREARRKSRTPFGESEPSSGGGFGYSRDLASHEDCPGCDGAGEPWVVTRPSEGHPLFAGAKQTRDGQVEIKVVDKMQALAALAKAAGVFERDDRRQSGGSHAKLVEALRERMRQAAARRC